MKILHLSDLHLGKRLYNFSLIEDQKHILERILEITAEESPEAVIIAGDIYDKPFPPAEAVTLFDDFLVKLSGLCADIFVISGNHDSAARIAFGGRLMERSGVHISPIYSGSVNPVVLRDSFGEATFWLLPFIKPGEVRRFFPDETIESYTDAVSAAIKGMNIDASCRNVLVSHQFVTGASISDSEEHTVGGLDNVDASVFADFDYVALGHIHSPQNIRCEGTLLRYCGTPLKYSYSEKDQVKSVTVAELREKGELSVREIPLMPLRDLIEIRGDYNTLVSKKFYEGLDTQSFVHAVLTDEDEVFEAMAKLRTVYPNITSLNYDNSRTRRSNIGEIMTGTDKRSPLELFMDFYRLQNNNEMTESQIKLADDLIERIWEEAK
ncbi:MAG: exonuclease SbcCD subunit D [Lachnospiraceae bacterium]|nr:exonuclease SbcCD subunit D [Lachnospiraceae bacterium]